MRNQRFYALLFAALLPVFSAEYEIGEPLDRYERFVKANADDDNAKYTYHSTSQVPDNIEFWTSFNIRAKRCVNYNNTDVVVFELFLDQCFENIVGTYYTSVPHYMDGYMSQMAQKMEDRGVNDYSEPDVAKYRSCTPKEVAGEWIYLQLGCADDNTKSIAVNIYKDSTCETRYQVDGMDDANIDISEIQLPFKKCQPCVNWVNKEDNQIDDKFYTNRHQLAPLCSTVWSYKEKCGNKCQRVGLKAERDQWKQPEITLLTFIIAFGIIMVGGIWYKRQKMPQKDALLEEAAISATGLQPYHVVTVVALAGLVIAVFAVLHLKNVTFALILIADVLLFGYLMKLTYDSGAKEIQVGPDGQIIDKVDSDDSEDASKASSIPEDEPNPNNGTYFLPTLT